MGSLLIVWRRHQRIFGLRLETALVFSLSLAAVLCSFFNSTTALYNLSSRYGKQIKLSQCLIKHHAMKAYKGMEM
jgi:hypothetical protein